jgi:multiple sugar transport system ATP-binding protein
VATIECRNIVKRYADAQVVHDFNLRVDDNEFVVLLGPSGCGKSTLLRMLAGLEEISGGELLIDGAVVNDLDPGERGIAMVFQNYALYPHMTVADNIAFGLRRIKVPESQIRERIGQVAGMLGLEPYLQRRPAELSGGQQQRVAIARAMIKTPKVFLFDEPLSNLDAKLRNHMRVEIARLHQSLKTTTVYVTHDQHEAMTLADRIVLLKDGRIEQVGTPEEIYERPNSRFVAGFIGTPPMNLLEMQVRREGNGFLLTSAHGTLRVSAERYALAGHDRVTVGVRPVHLQLAPAGAVHNVLFGAVDLVEYLGHEVQVNLAHGAGHLSAIVPSAQRPALGERLGFAVQEEHLHIFDAAEGRTLAVPGAPLPERQGRYHGLRQVAA